jgi:hypothetical protein
VPSAQYVMRRPLSRELSVHETNCKYSCHRMWVCAEPSTCGCGVACECVYVWSTAHICVAQCRRTARNANNSPYQSEPPIFFSFIQRTNRSSYFHVTLTLSGHEAGTLTTNTHQIHQITPTKAHVKIM